MRQLRWSVPAVEDLERICLWIELDNPQAAQRVAQNVYSGCGRLRGLPYIGRISHRMPGWRELVLTPLPYIVVYRVTDTAVEIGRIFHGAQDWP